MNEFLLEAIKLVNPVQLALIALIMFFFYSRLDAKIEKLDLKIEKTDLKVDNLRQEIKQDLKELKAEFDSNLKAFKSESDNNFKEFKSEIKMEIKSINQRIDTLYQLIVSVFKKDAA